MHHIANRATAAVVITLVLLGAAAFLLLPHATAESSGTGWRHGAPATAGFHLVAWEGGTIQQAAATPGARSLWATVDGRFIAYHAGAPAIVNAGFHSQFPDHTIPSGTILLLHLGATDDISPVARVQRFFDDLEQAAPPVSSEGALIRTLAGLTEQTRAQLSTAGHLAAFLGVQDLPDIGVQLTLRTQTQTEARVDAVLGYSAGEAEREFRLIRDRDRWQISWVDTAPLNAASTPAQVAHSFLVHFIASAPPTVSPHPAISASELLTTSTRDALPTDVPLATALAGLVGVQDVPDMGFEVGVPVVSGTTATVVVTLQYSGGDTMRTLTLVQVDGSWRISAISS